MKKTTLVLGASPNAERYSYKAVVKLNKAGHKVFPIGIRAGEIDNIEIITDREFTTKVDTVTMYVGAKNQSDWYSMIFASHPKRIIFNPGAENDELKQLAEKRGIECEEACTLVLLATDAY